MSNGVSINISTIMDTIRRYFDEHHELRTTTHLQAYIEFNDDIVVRFRDLDELYLWVVKRQAELDEQKSEQLKENARINHESSSVDIFNQVW